MICDLLVTFVNFKKWFLITLNNKHQCLITPIKQQSLNFSQMNTNRIKFNETLFQIIVSKINLESTYYLLSILMLRRFKLCYQYILPSI